MENGAEIYRIPARLWKSFPMNVHTGTSLNVALREVGIVEGEPLVPCLLQLSQALEGMVYRFFSALPELRIP